MPAIRTLPAAIVLTLLAAPASYACSVTDDYRVPTNLELTEKAAAIFIGRVEGEQKNENPIDGALLVKPIVALKGALPEGRITLRWGSLADDRYLVLSNPYQLEGAHPLSYIGACIRHMFPLGATVLFFVDRKDGEWIPAFYAFSRWAEDVPNAEAPWPRLVGIYVRAAALPVGDRRAMLEAERDRLRADPADPVARLMAADIDRQLAGPNRPWNTIMEEQSRR